MPIAVASLAAIMQVLRDVLTPGGQAKVLTAAIVGILLGAALGLVPFIYGRRRGLGRLGLVVLGASATAGMLLGIWVSLPAAIGFTFAIWRGAHRSSGPATTAESLAGGSLFN